MGFVRFDYLWVSMNKRIVCLLCCILLTFSVLCGLFVKSGTAVCCAVTEGDSYTDGTDINCAYADVLDDLGDLVTGAKPAEPQEEVYLGGFPLGLTIDGNGVTVIGLNEFFNQSGELCCPALEAGLQINDVVLQLDGRKIYGSAKLGEIVAACKGRELEIVYSREGKQYTQTIHPQKDLTAGNYRLGLWTKDSSCGIGTLTYVRKNLSFGCLGHPITDKDNRIVACDNGGVFDCTVNGVECGKSGAAGELHGTISYDVRLGSIYANNKYGVYGSFNRLPSFCGQTIQVADVVEVHPGAAQIYCTLDDGTRQVYDIEIIKANRQTVKGDKGIVFRVTDERLIARAGGIVQGMSGSPIVQNGKLVACVTHVFVNDPTKGYGLYVKWMLAA